MPSPSALPVEARRAAWDALWRRLLAPILDDNNPDEEAPTDDAPSERSAPLHTSR
jgi:hypothetical protein